MPVIYFIVCSVLSLRSLEPFRSSLTVFCEAAEGVKDESLNDVLPSLRWLRLRSAQGWASDAHGGGALAPLGTQSPGSPASVLEGPALEQAVQVPVVCHFPF